MQHLAGEFASSPSGYVIAVLVSVLILLVGFIGKMIFNRLDKQDDKNEKLTLSVNSLQENVKGLAVAVGDFKTEVAGLRRDRIRRGQ